MNTIDASIPLQAGQGVQQPSSQMDLGKMLSLAKIAEAMKQKNAIKNVFAQPGNLDNGQLTQQGISQLFQVDPEQAIALEGAQTQRQLRDEQIQDAQFKRHREYVDAVSEEATPLWNKYSGLLKNGMKPEEAATVMQEDWTSARDRLKGLPQDVLSTIPERFDPAKLEQSVTMRDKLRLQDEARKTAKDERDEKRLDLSERREDAFERRLADNQANKPDPNAAGWDVLTDPSKKDDQGNPTPYRFNKRTGEAVTFDGKPYTPGGVAKVAAGGAKGGTFTPEMGELQAALAELGVSLPTGMRSREQQISLYQGLLDRNQGKSPADIAKLLKTGQIEFGAQKKETQTAAAVAGKVEVFGNEIKEGVPLVEKISAKVPREKFLPISKLLQMGDTQLNDPDLIELKVRINGILNAYDALAARGGTDKDKRAEARSLITSANDHTALMRALKTFDSEADIAHNAAVKATKVPELEGPGGSASAGETPKPTAKSVAVPPAYKDKEDGTVLYDGKGFAYRKKGDQLELIE